MNISEQELLSMLEEAYQSGYESYLEQMTAKCYSIVKKCKDKKKPKVQQEFLFGSNTPLSDDNPYVFTNSETDHHIQFSAGHQGLPTLRGTDSAVLNRNGDDFSNVEINSIPENVTIQHIDGNTYTL